VNPLQGFKRVFSSRALMEGAKATAKLIVFGWVAYSAVNSEWGRVSTLSTLTPAQSSAVVGGMLHSVLLRVSMVWLVIAGADYFFQRKSVDKQL
ncbi:EscU/YscU/HrcU family type III secretion system export apparatus switch protein, partial [Acinetobacter baumannii]